MVRRWTESEDVKLRLLIQRHGDQRGRNSKWNEISKELPGRTNKDCRKRWFHSLHPSLCKGRWTADEDRVLVTSYQRLGPAWKEIALRIPGRKDDQCAKRYNEILCPSAESRLRAWAADEDRVLQDKVAELGHAWSAISFFLPGRPPLTCRNRWRRLSRTIASSMVGNEAPLTRGMPAEALAPLEAVVTDVDWTAILSDLGLEEPALNPGAATNASEMEAPLSFNSAADVVPERLDAYLTAEDVEVVKGPAGIVYHIHHHHHYHF